MAKILIVEDNQGTNKAICEYMKEAGHTLFSAFTGSEALKIFREKELDIIVLDIMLPEMSGIVVLHEIRKISNIPVIMLTALDDEYTQSNSFDEMADDYITKPFSMLILGKRITALLRRSQSKPAVNMIKLGDVTVDFSGYTACDENGKIDITPKELEILKVLIEDLDNRRKTLSKAIADLSVETLSSQQIELLSGYLDDWENISFEDKRKAADGLISSISATSDYVKIEWKI